jgi:hypothetical protein
MVSTTGSGTYGSWTRRFSDSAETSPSPEPLPEDDGGQQQPANETVARINRQEKGDLSTKDKYEWAEVDNGISVAAEAAAVERKKIAKEITDAAKRVVGNHGTIKLATSLQLLRRALSKCHDILRDRKTESDYLSIIVLAEKVLSQEKWRALSKDVLQQLKAALAIGEANDRVTYDDFNRVFRLLDATGSVSGPVLDFDDAVMGSDG